MSIEKGSVDTGAVNQAYKPSSSDDIKVEIKEDTGVDQCCLRTWWAKVIALLTVLAVIGGITALIICSNGHCGADDENGN